MTPKTEIPIVRTQDATRTLTISLTNRRLILVEAAGALRLEVGGGLYGHPGNSWDTTLRISNAHGPGPGTRVTEDSCTLCPGDLAAGERSLRQQGLDDIRCIGTWHSHPNGNDPEPSSADLKCWARQRAILGEDNYLSTFLAIIVTRGDKGWKNAELHAWRVTHENHGTWDERISIEPLTIQTHGLEPNPWPTPTSLKRVTEDSAPADDATNEQRERQQHTSARKPRRPATSKHSGKVMVATRTFTTIDGGIPVTVNKGEFVNDPNHSIVQAHPHDFKRA